METMGILDVGAPMQQAMLRSAFPRGFGSQGYVRVPARERAYCISIKSRLHILQVMIDRSRQFEVRVAARLGRYCM